MSAQKLTRNISSVAPWMLMFIGVLFCQGSLAQQPPSMSANIHQNCTGFSIASNGVLSATCQTSITAVPGGVNVTTATKTIDLDDYLGNDLPNQNSPELELHGLLKCL